MKRLFEKYGDDLRGLFWLFLGVFLSASLFSYSPLDSSFNSITLGGRPQNLCGYIGSFISDLLYQGFGVGAWVFVFAMLRLSYRSFIESHPKREKRHWWIDGILLGCVICLTSLYFGDVRVFGGQIRLGGWVGHFVTSGMVGALNRVGWAICLWTCLAGLIVLYVDRPIASMLSRPFDQIMTTIENLKAATQRLVLWVGQNRRPSNGQISRPKNLEVAPKAGFFKIRTEAKVTVDKTVPEEDFLSEPVGGDEFSLGAPITGFLKEQISAHKKTTRPALSISRRVANWELPKLSLLEDPPSTRARLDEREIKNKARLLVEKLGQFSVRGEVVGIKPGPAVTMFEFKPAADVKISRITDLADDLSLALSSESVRIIAPIPGRDVVGIETSNSTREAVFVKEIVTQEPFWNEDCKLPLALGRKADGEPRIVDLRKMPHLLVAGSTGSGKSVFIVSIITGLLFRHSPKTLKLILVDPKQVDLAAFNDLPHLIMPPIREAKKAVGALRWAIREMEKRYRSMSKFGARGLESFNETVADLAIEKQQEHAAKNDALEGRFHPESYYFQPLPYVVIVVEEFGDLMSVDKINVEQAVVRLAQMARACGIHLVLAMQSPRRDVVTGLIKTNIPGRISFKVASKMDSRIILDEGGAERLLARGDMLFLAPGVSKPERHHGPFLSEEEIRAVVDSWKSQGEPEYDALAMKAIDGSGGGFESDRGDSANSASEFEDGDEIKDDRYDEVLEWVAAQKEVSASLLQRKFRLGYPRAARMIEIFATEGVVGPANGSKPRTVLVRELPR